jgi:predicted amidohydrolase
VKIALAQINPTIGDFSGNLKKILDFTRRAVDAGADLTVFPELAVCGYLPADFLEKDVFIARASETLAKIAEQTAYTSVLCGAALPSGVITGKHVRNVAA